MPLGVSLEESGELWGKGKMDDWHNCTVQGQRNTAMAKKMKAKAARELSKWAKENKIAPRVEITQDDFPVRKISKRRMMPKLPKMSKAELREMLSQIVKETARK